MGGGNYFSRIMMASGWVVLDGRAAAVTALRPGTGRLSARRFVKLLERGSAHDSNADRGQETRLVCYRGHKKASARQPVYGTQPLWLKNSGRGQLCGRLHSRGDGVRAGHALALTETEQSALSCFFLNKN